MKFPQPTLYYHGGSLCITKNQNFKLKAQGYVHMLRSVLLGLISNWCYRWLLNHTKPVSIYGFIVLWQNFVWEEFDGEYSFRIDKVVRLSWIVRFKYYFGFIEYLKHISSFSFCFLYVINNCYFYDCRWLDGNSLTGPIPDFTGCPNLKKMYKVAF